MPEGNFVKKSPEKLEIEQLQEEHKAGQFWTRQFLFASIAIIVVSVFLPISGQQFLVAAAFGYLMFIIHFILDIRDRKRSRAIWKKIYAYQRKKNVPLYNEVQEKFGKDYHVHLDDTGAILLKRNDVPKTEKHDDKQKD